MVLQAYIAGKTESLPPVHKENQLKFKLPAQHDMLWSEYGYDKLESTGTRLHTLQFENYPSIVYLAVLLM